MAKVLLHTIGFVALLHLAAIGLTYLGISNNPLIHMLVIGVVVLMAGEFVMKAWRMRWLIKSIDVRRGKLVYRSIYHAYYWYTVYVVGLFFLPEYLCHLEGSEYRVLSLGWGLRVDMGLFTILLDGFVVLALTCLVGHVDKLKKRIGY